eukprot:5018127-Prymnesium_polylepis.1
MMLLGDVDGLLPASTREVFRIEELVLASERRTQVFFFGQFVSALREAQPRRPHRPHPHS